MADPYDYIESTGIVVSDTADTLTQVQNEFKAAFGEDLDVSPSTPAGLLIAAEVLSRDGIARNNATLANQINPNVAGGIFLDAIWALTGGGRTVATKSTVTATLAGIAGVAVPAGTKVATVDGNEFELIGDVTLPGTGSFASVEYGPIPAAAGDLTEIVDSVLGWDSVVNADAATLGQNTQSDSSARIARRNQLALMGATIAESIMSGLYALEGVTSVAFRENSTDTSAVIDGITLLPHSIWACVYGGSSADIAGVLLARKSMGAAFNGSTTVPTAEPSSGQSYVVRFDRPVEIPISLRVTIKSGSVSTDPVAAVRLACVNYATNNLGIGTDVSPFEFAGAINIDNEPFFVQKVEAKKTSGGTWSSDEIAIALSEIATLQSGAVTVIQT